MTIPARAPLVSAVTVAVGACLAISGVAPAAAVTPAALPDVSVTLPTVRVLTIPGFGLAIGRSEVVITVRNTGAASAHNVSVDARTLPSRFAVHTVLASLDAGSSTTLSLGENTGSIYFGLATVAAHETEPDANPTNNTATGLRLLVGDFTGIQ